MNIKMTIDGTEYVAIPRDEYERLVGGDAAPRNEALDFVLEALGRNLRAAREHGGFTQAQLAKKLKKAQSTVSGSEAGKIRVSAGYVRKVLKVCGLPEDWKAPAD